MEPVQYIYGIHAVDSLIRQRPETVARLLVAEGREDKRITALLELARNQGVAVVRCPRAELDNLVAGRHQGVVVQTSQAQGSSAASGSNLWSEAELLQRVEQMSEPCLLLVLDGITDPHNLGACLRSADAAGVNAVIVPKDNAVDLTPVVRKVACGAAEVVPFVRVTNISRTLKALQERAVWLYGADGGAEKPIYDNDLTQSAAIVMGAEGKGLRRLTKEQCDYLVSLPMAGSVSSLNVSVATGICLFEVVRQRAEKSAQLS